MTIKEAKTSVGSRVIYEPFKGCSDSSQERGVITSVNDVFVFVRYGNDCYSKATRPDDLKFEFPNTKNLKSSRVGNG